MARRFVFKKWNQDTEYAHCWYCNNKTLFFIFDKKTGEEFFCCSECALKKHKIKRLRNLLKKYPLRQKSLKISSNLPLKKIENEQSQEGSDENI